MPLAEFRRRFGDCFDPGPRVQVNDGEMRGTWLLTNLSRCRDLHPGFDQQVVVEGPLEILAVQPRSDLHEKVVPLDAGA